MPPYPGLGLPLRHLKQGGQNYDLYPIGIHANCFGSDSEMLLIREVAMMIVMDRLTDKPDFHIKVFDEAITSKWIDEALALPLDQWYDEIVAGKDHRMFEYDENGEKWYYPKKLRSILDKGCLEYCIQELRAKAEFYKKTGLVPTLDASASVVKSDTFVDQSLHDALRAAFSKLQDDQIANPDWHPRTDEKVQDLIHPSLYPLVYGRTRVFDDEVVGVEDAIDKWAGKGDVIPHIKDDEPTTGFRRRVSIGSIHIEPSFWSTKYQWLPSNVKFQDDGSVKFTSYINNLHPNKYRDIYTTIEKLVEKALPAWNLCLARYHDHKHVGAGRTEPRFPRPENPDDEEPSNWSPQFKDFELPQTSEPEARSGEERYKEEEDGHPFYGTRKEIEWQKIREPVQPEAPDFKAWDYGIKPGSSLQERFDGLQIIVKMASIELTPEKPEFPAGGWHVEGQMNEHIIATALYYLDSENITPSHLHFRMQTSTYQDDWDVGQDSYKWMEQVYGTHLSGGPCIQNYGSVETRQGRLLAFPNVFHHRVSPFELKDKTKPGHRRFIALWLVDPHTRVISTANVPPQQQSWWMERAFGGISECNAEKVPNTIAQLILEKAPGHPGLEASLIKGEQLPAELMSMVHKEFGDALPMSAEEAKEHRLRLMDERTTVQGEVKDSWLRVNYSFCEH